MNKETILKQCTVDGHIVRLPAIQLDRDLYLEVKKTLNLIGGIWKGGKTNGFVFQEDPTQLLEQIAAGGKRNLKKEFQFFGTSGELADELVFLANPRRIDKILEPSAGQGAIVQAINRFCEPDTIFCYELMPLNQSFLNKICNVKMLGDDFLKCNEQFDRIIANPPFAKNQDIDHIYKMYDCLNTGGRIVTMCSKHYQFSGNKKEKQFREWLDKLGAITHEVPEGAFKESGTNIATVILIINKRNYPLQYK